MTTHVTSRSRAAFSLVEVLMALSLLGVGLAGLTAALAGDRRIRDLAAAHARAAARARELLEVLAARPCPGDTAGSSADAWGSESWRATAADGAWALTDSLALRGSRTPLVIEARVACPD